MTLLPLWLDRTPVLRGPPPDGKAWERGDATAQLKFGISQDEKAVLDSMKEPTRRAFWVEDMSDATYHRQVFREGIFYRWNVLRGLMVPERCFSSPTTNPGED